MSTRQSIVTGLVVVAVIAGLWFLIPPGAGIKSQLGWFGRGIFWLVTWIVGIVLWFAEAIILFIGPWFLGWFFRWALKRLDERWTPDQDLTRLQGFLLNLGLLVVTFLLWLLVPLVVTWAPPVSVYILGPWIRSHMETGLVWWGLYGALSYMFFPPFQNLLRGVK